MWTTEIVKARFIEAAATERRMPLRKVGGFAGSWPQYVHSFEDMNGWGTKRLAEEREMRFRRTAPSAEAISRHFEALQWTGELISDERHRRIVWAWAWCQATNRSFAARCRREGWVRMTAYRGLTAAFEEMTRKLCNNGVLVRLPDAEWMLPSRESALSGARSQGEIARAGSGGDFGRARGDDDLVRARSDGEFAQARTEDACAHARTEGDFAEDGSAQSPLSWIAEDAASSDQPENRDFKWSQRQASRHGAHLRRLENLRRKKLGLAEDAA